MSKKWLLLGSFILVLQAVPALADSHESGNNAQDKHISKHDTDGDGVISRDEFLNKAEERFEKIDADGDGKITREEGKNARKKFREERKERIEERKEKRSE